MQRSEFSQLLERLSINFKNINLLKQSFIHRSHLNEVRLNSDSNERLEFLGDSVLSLVVSFYLFNQRSQDAEGELTNLRAYVVKTKSLAEAAKRLDLGNYLKLSKGEERSGGRENPQLLANTYEALLGAVYLDQGFAAAQTVVQKTLLSLFAGELKAGPPKDAKSQLQEFVQEKFKQSPHYKTIQTRGPDHAKEFVVGVFIKGKEYGRGEGNSKQEAEEQAAKEALEKLINKPANFHLTFT